MMITIYGKSDCGFCKMAEALCKNNEYEYQYLSMGTDFERDYIVENFPRARTFPVVLVDGEVVGGFQELKVWHDKNKG